MGIAIRAADLLSLRNCPWHAWQMGSAFSGGGSDASLSCVDFTGRGGDLPRWPAAGPAVSRRPGRDPLFADRSPNAIPVDTELVLAVDVSYSMDPEEQALQREGYITGITSREFMQALRGGMHGKVAVTYFEWAGPYDQKIVVPVAADRRPGSRRCVRQRNRPGALPAGVPHLDLRCADVRQAAVRRLGLSRHPPRGRRLRRRRQQQRRTW